MKNSPFRNWVNKLWVANCEERAVFQSGARLSPTEYFQKFRWWLRREWRHQQSGSSRTFRLF